MKHEISIFQNPNLKISQIAKFVVLMEKEGWVLLDTSEENNKRKEIQKSQNSWSDISFQLKKLKTEQTLDIVHQNHEYTITPVLSDNNIDLKLLNKLIYSILKEDFHFNKTECRNIEDKKTSWIHTDIYHEGVLILASSNQLKNYFSLHKFDYDFPSGINQLINSESIIAINSYDEDFETLINLEIRKENLENSIAGKIKTIGLDDEILLLHHGDFTMICDNHKGDYKSYGWKHIISFPPPIEGTLNFAISKTKSNEEQQLIFELTDNCKTINSLLEIQEIPTHNTV